MRIRDITLRATLAAMLVAPAAVAGQDVDAERTRRARAERALGVEAVMRLRDRLELTEEQIARLDQVRAATVAERSRRRAEMAELRSQVEAGQLDRAAARERMAAWRGESGELRAGARAEIEGILTETQRDSLRLLETRARAFQRGRASVRGGRGIRGGRPGMRGGRELRGGRRGMRGGRMGMRGGRMGMWGGRPAVRGGRLWRD